MSKQQQQQPEVQHNAEAGAPALSAQEELEFRRYRAFMNTYADSIADQTAARAVVAMKNITNEAFEAHHRLTLKKGLAAGGAVVLSGLFGWVLRGYFNRNKDQLLEVGPNSVSS